ncbi:MOSC domain-containing protein [Demetria terragena]|uniref:MOSC domain-containing protein n=1 Tax=Demetria terragena TaxID=63959 RepID=UPI00039E950A|nr:MOSC domain-containing protein [Demetria terragena]
MTAQVLSVNVGAPSPPLGKGTWTGIGKQPVAQATVRAPGPKDGGLGSGLVGDFIGDRASHGGDHQAVYAVAREELDFWQTQLGQDLPNGWFGENLTTLGLDVDAAILGQEWAIGEDVVLRVDGPRVPCVTFATRMGVPGWLKSFTAHERPGAYLSVVRPGTIRPGDVVVAAAAPAHGIDVSTAFRAWMGNAQAARNALAAGVMATEKDHLERVAARASSA